MLMMMPGQRSRTASTISAQISGSQVGRCPMFSSCRRKCRCTIAAPASNASLQELAISSTVTGTGCCLGLVRTPVIAQVMIALSLMTLTPRWCTTAGRADTWSPAATDSSATVPARGATTRCSIFMDSTLRIPLPLLHRGSIGDVDREHLASDRRHHPSVRGSGLVLGRSGGLGEEHRRPAVVDVDP